MFKWILGKFSYVFWSLVASSILMAASTFSPYSQKKMLELVAGMKAVKNNAASAVSGGLPNLSKSKNEIPIAAETEGHSQISSSSNEYIVDNKNYVFIEGNYYPASKDNRYLVKGKMVYYVNNRRLGIKEAEAAAARQIAKAKADADEDGDAQGSSDDSMVMTPAQMMETVKRAQQATKERNKILKDLDSN